MGNSDSVVRRAFVAGAIAAVALVAVLVLLNLIADPYLIFDTPRMDGLNARKPAVSTQQLMMKAEDVLRSRPKTVLLGSSRVDIGLDASSAEWLQRDKPVYNLAMPGGDPYTAYRYLQHLIGSSPPSLVLLGLDFEYFLKAPDSRRRTLMDATAEARLTTDRENRINPGRLCQRARDAYRAAVSLRAVLDSMTTIHANVRGKSADMVAGHWRFNTGEYLSFSGNANVVFGAMNVLTLRTAKGASMDQARFKEVQYILDACRQHRIKVILLINPVHADDLEVIDLLGYWRLFEDWKRDLLRIAGKYSGTGGAPIPLWDFTGFSAYTTEAPDLKTLTSGWFFDSVHYTPALGDVVIRTISGNGEAGFGVLLTSANIEDHIASIRSQRDFYRRTHPYALRRLRYLQASIEEAHRGVRRVRPCFDCELDLRSAN
jgi:hypothetical protein